MRPEEYYNFEERAYETPTQSRDEQMSFIDNLRATQQATNAQIKTQTENLGTQIPSVKGGLTGPEGYFQQRYQVTPTNALVADLKAAAQADALNKVLSNYGEQAQKRYNDAYRQYQKNRAKRQAAANRAASSGGSGAGTGSGTGTGVTGGTDLIPSQEGVVNEKLAADVLAEHEKYPDAGLITTIQQGDYYYDDKGNKIPIYKKTDERGNVIETNDPSYGVQANTSAGSALARYATTSAAFGPFGFVPGVISAIFGGN